MRTAKFNADQESRDTVKYFTIPGDVIMDVLYILFNNSLHYDVKTVNRNDNSILLYVSQEKQPSQFHKAIENIEAILSTYNQYISGIPGNESWDESANFQ